MIGRSTVGSRSHSKTLMLGGYAVWRRCENARRGEDGGPSCSIPGDFGRLQRSMRWPSVDPFQESAPVSADDRSPLRPFGEDNVTYTAYAERISRQGKLRIPERSFVAPRVTIVIPAWNEAGRIGPTVESIVEHMDARAEPWELIISDDGSTDDTIGVVQNLGLQNLRILAAPENRGKGHAVRSGMLAARGDLVLFADADRSTPISFIDDLIAEVEAGASVAVGSRAVDGSLEESKSVGRRLCSSSLRFLVRHLFSLGVKDTQCGFKMFTRDAAQDLFQRQRIDGFSFDLEVLFLAQQADWKTVEVPVDWIDAPGSTVNATRVALRFLRDLSAIRIDHSRGRHETPAAKPSSSIELRSVRAPKEGDELSDHLLPGS